MAEILLALMIGHQVGDHWVQTQHQADHKGNKGWSGRIACASHVITYGLTQLVALLALALTHPVDINPTRLTIGMAINLITHYIADRRAPLRWIAERLGSGQFYNLGVDPDRPSLGTGSYALDQSWHYGWMFISALIITGGVPW